MPKSFMYLLKDFHDAMARIQQNFLSPKINTILYGIKGKKIQNNISPYDIYPFMICVITHSKAI